MKKIIIIIAGTCFFLSGIVMPYADFSDIRAVRFLYSQLRAQDADLNLEEFVCDKLLGVGELFEQDEADEQVNTSVPINTGLPVTLQLQPGVLFCDKAEEKTFVQAAFDPKPACRFKDNKFSRKIRTAVFHPPANCCSGSFLFLNYGHRSSAAAAAVLFWQKIYLQQAAGLLFMVLQ